MSHIESVTVDDESPYWTPNASQSGASVGLTLWRPGRLSTIGHTTRTTQSLTQDRLYYHPMIFEESVTIDAVGVDVTTAGGAGAVVRLGLYADDDGWPGSRLVDFGTVASTSTGIRTIAVSQTIDAGVYWVATVGQVSGSTVVRATQAPVVSVPSAAPAVTIPIASLYEASISGALPASPNATLTEATPAMLIHFRKAS